MLTVLKYKWPLWVLPMPLLFVWTWNGPFIYVCPCGTQTQQFKTIANKSKIQTKYSEMQKNHIHSTLILYLLVFYLFIYTIRPFKPGPTQHYKSNKFIKFRSLFYSQNNITDFCNYKVSAFEKRDIIYTRNVFTWACQGYLIKGNWVYIRGWVVKGWVTKSNCWLTACSFHFWAVVIV